MMAAGKSTFKFSAPTIEIDGGSITINIICEDSSYSHKLLHSHGEITTLKAGTTSYTWTPTAAQLVEFFEEIPSQKSRLIDVYLDTYDGSTKVGRDVHSLTVTLSEATGKPTVSDFTITDSNATATSLGVIVDGKSTLTASAKATGKYGATISKNIFTCEYGNGKHYESYQINDLIASLPLTTTNVAIITFGYKSTDSRGFSTTATLDTKNIVGYKSPHIDTFEVIRCDDSGNESETGTKAKVTIKGAWAAMRQGQIFRNPATLKVGHKTKDATSYTYEKITVVAGEIDISQLLSATLTTGTDYEFSVELTDKFETYRKEGVGCSNVQNILYVSADGKNLVIGPDTGNNVAIKPDGIDIRNKSTLLATFNDDSIKLGCNKQSSIIDLCNGSGSISASTNDNGVNLNVYGDHGALIGYEGDDGYARFFGRKSKISNPHTGNPLKFAAMFVGDDTVGSCGIDLTSGFTKGSSILNMTAGTININNTKLSDFVVAEGKCDFWTYRMWNSGIAECWGHTGQTTVSVTSEWGSLYDSGTGHTNGFPGNTTASSALKFNVTIGGTKYTKLFTSVEHCECNFISSNNAFMIEVGAGLTNLQTPQVFLLRATSATVTGKFSYHAIGRWKA